MEISLKGFGVGLQPWSSAYAPGSPSALAVVLSIASGSAGADAADAGKLNLFDIVLALEGVELWKMKDFKDQATHIKEVFAAKRKGKGKGESVTVRFTFLARGEYLRARAAQVWAFFGVPRNEDFHEGGGGGVGSKADVEAVQGLESKESGGTNDGDESDKEVVVASRSPMRKQTTSRSSLATAASIDHAVMFSPAMANVGGGTEARVDGGENPAMLTCGQIPWIDQCVFGTLYYVHVLWTVLRCVCIETDTSCSVEICFAAVCRTCEFRSLIQCIFP